MDAVLIDSAKLGKFDKIILPSPTFKLVIL